MRRADGSASARPALGDRKLHSCPFGSHLEWYWSMGEALFSRIREGIQLDEVGLVAVKPELDALRCAGRLPGRTALDAFAGIGGSAIALARTGKRVLSLDLNPTRLRMARNNARVYEVESRILFARADTRQLLGRVEVDAVYLDPPWGGMEAAEAAHFGLQDFTPAGDALLTAALASASHVALSVPPNFEFSELERFHPELVVPAIYEGEILYYDVFFRRVGRARLGFRRTPQRASGVAGPAESERART